MRDGDSPDYEVGYGKPPRSSQFPPGHSGNPKGRPKKQRLSGRAKSLEEIFFATAQEEMTVRINGKDVIMTMEEIMIRQIFKGAAEGKTGAMKILIPLLTAVRQREKDGYIPSAEERAMMTPEAVANAYKRLMAAG